MSTYDLLPYGAPAVVGLLFLFLWLSAAQQSDRLMRPELLLSAFLYLMITTLTYYLFTELATGYRILAVANASASLQRQAAYVMGRTSLSNLFHKEEACINLANGAVRDRFNHSDCAVGQLGVNLRYGTPTAEETSMNVLLARENSAHRFRYRFDGEYALLTLDGRPQCLVRYAPAPLLGLPPLVSYDVGGC
ncbi:hypothetical protein [Hydrogenophilus thiooxidans]|uniref:hypothetical protein n=1 Tax=Hydrogenophilus thiooxidans TaxID=2820326 RepID=UPI001C2127B0|nr:hypothetical protein [Hydrogenophilus thiooxidans]